MEKIKVKLGFEGLFTIEPIGRGGGGGGASSTMEGEQFAENSKLFHVAY
jgi:hypothetical protein